MKYKIIIKETALEDLEHYRKTGQKKTAEKIDGFINELREHPETGTGQPKKLKHELSDYWSRKIDKKNRLIYSIDNDIVTVIVISALGHYGDK
jgi:toxin YoeB